MYICQMYSKELTKGTLMPIILKLISENDKMYGYEITQHVKELTKGKIDISEAL
jgi:PadR family transcriptional regulator, regulatory protein PadR